MRVLQETSRTFFIPISYLPAGLQETVAAAYLCMRAIDEIEDHPYLQPQVKHDVLQAIRSQLRMNSGREEFLSVIEPWKQLLPEVTVRLYDWIELCPQPVLPQVLEATALMAGGMADWSLKGWQIQTEEDLNQYTFYVAGLVGLMLSDIWAWYDGTKTDQLLAVAFGRGLQAVNILRNSKEDSERGVTFFPEGWEYDDMLQYARHNLSLADLYIEDLQPGPVLHFCQIPLALAHATLDALVAGKEKMSRAAVHEVVNQVLGESR
ncbi:phytoene/squalene synthase family protein [Ectobacillus sp. SYSU M60031]|uniref:Phytoene/squalene synthase family protein n=1 Tax=Ectobacillus ponti TaxID=2961894 RepID=A0AA41XCL8_9BACI|nr:phytoene/squalene synthase family protein [Ectobacillus ponti]MCP8970418.1 phytoene/squalene synthase family protein [Ectobacillus ponti]